MNERVMIVEMVGICGAGKSSLYHLLHHRNNRIVKLPPPPKTHYFFFLLKVVYKWLPLYLVKYRSTRWLSLEEIRLMAYLDTWLPYIKREAVKNKQIVVLDPGSVYWLSALREYGPEITQSAQFKKWWDQKFELWKNALDVIVWLDAPDELLYDRIVNRVERHEMQDQPKETAIASFVRYRAQYKQIINQISVHRDIRIYPFFTDKISTDQMADQIYDVFSH